MNEITSIQKLNEFCWSMGYTEAEIAEYQREFKKSGKAWVELDKFNNKFLSFKKNKT